MPRNLNDAKMERINQLLKKMFENKLDHSFHDRNGNRLLEVISLQFPDWESDYGQMEQDAPLRLAPVVCFARVIVQNGGSDSKTTDLIVKTNNAVLLKVDELSKLYEIENPETIGIIDVTNQ